MAVYRHYGYGERHYKQQGEHGKATAVVATYIGRDAAAPAPVAPHV